MLILAASVAVVAAVVVGVAQSGGGDDDALAPLSAQAVRERTAGAPPRLAAVHAQGNRLLEGSTRALEARIAKLRGLPVVVNVWGSWCTPCRAEFPIFQRVSVDLADRVAFLGVATTDPVDDAAAFLHKVPVPYPSYLDFKGAVGEHFGLLGTPSTIFYDRRGRPTLHQGEYTSTTELEADIGRYALRG